MKSVFGQQLGRYVLLEKLGEGGMATVYNAYDSRLERNVAIKMILPARQNSQLFLERFILEAKALAQLSHTNIVKVLDYGEENESPYLVMEYVQGGTLKEVMQGPLPWQQAAAILAPIARALDYVHKQQIIHRDVKPTNILLDENDQPMLSDFGIVKLMESDETVDSTMVSVGIGTPDYMSPEQGMGKEVDFRADIYALGVVFYELVTGKKPYTADGPMGIVIKHVTGEFPKPSKEVKDLPIFVEEAILKAVAKNPAQRYPDMGKFADVLEHLMQMDRSAQKELKKLVHIKRPASLVKKITTAGIFILLSLVLFSAALLFRSELRSFAANTGILSYLFAEQSTATSAITMQFTPTSWEVAASVSDTPAPTRTPRPTKTQTPDATPTPRPVRTRKINYENIALAGTPITHRLSGIDNGNLTEIARWGIGGVTTVAWSSAGDKVALGTTDGIYIYDSQTLELTLFIKTDGWVNKLLFADGDRIIIGALITGKAQIWSTSDGSLRRTYKYQQIPTERLKRVQSSPATSLAISPNERYLAVGFENGALTIWELNTDNLVLKSEQARTVTDMEFSSDGRYLYAAKGDSEVKIWDLNTGRADDSFRNLINTVNIDLSSDGNILVGCGDSASVILVDAISNRILYTYLNLGGLAEDVTISADNKLLAIAFRSGEIKIFKMPTADEQITFQRELRSINAHTGRITNASFSPNSHRLASTSMNEGIKIWDADSGDVDVAMNLNTLPVKQLIFSHNSNYLFANYTDNQIDVWKMNLGTIVYTTTGYIPEGNVLSRQRGLIVIARDGARTWDTGTLHVIRAATGEEVITLYGYKPGWLVSFSPDEQLLVTGNTREAIIWDTSLWQRRKIHGGLRNGCGQYFTPDNQRLAMITEAAIVFNYNEKLLTLCSMRPKGATPITLLNDQKYALYQMIPSGLWLWGMDAREVTGENRTNIIDGVDKLLAVSEDSNLLVFSMENSVVLLNKITNIRGSGSLAEFPNQEYEQFTAAISPDNKYLVLGSQYGTITVWTGGP